MQTLKTQVKDLRAKAKARAEADADGNILPLPYFLGLLNDPEAEEGVRFAAAKAAAPFLHPRLEAVMFQDQTGRLTHEQALLEIERHANGGDQPPIINHDAQGGMAVNPPEEKLSVTGRKADQDEAV